MKGVLRGDQAQTLFAVVEFANRTGRTPTSTELAARFKIASTAARARLSRLRRAGFLVGAGDATSIKRTAFVTEPQTALALTRFSRDCGRSPVGSLGKTEVLRILHRAGVPTQAEASRRLLELLLQGGYVEGVSPYPDRYRPGPQLAAQLPYLELLGRLALDRGPVTSEPTGSTSPDRRRRRAGGTRRDRGGK